MIKKIEALKFFFKIMRTAASLVLPKNRFGDKVFAYINFIARHNRLPTRKVLFNDVLFNIKTTEEIINPLRVFISDKEFLKIYVKALLGEKYCVPTIAVIENIIEVDSFNFPKICCIKPTHASGKVILRENGENLDRSLIKKWFRLNYYHASREANYKNLKPKVIIEPIIFNRSNLEDYKFFCFNGEPRFIQVDIDRHTNHSRKFFDTNWNELEFSIAYPKSTKSLSKPKNFDEMISVTKVLSKNFPMIRVDLYSDGNQIYVGELTNTHGSAEEKFIPQRDEIKASKLLFGSENI